MTEDEVQAIGATDEQTDAAAAEVGHAEERGLLRRWKRRDFASVGGGMDPAADVGPLISRILRCRGLGDAAAAELFLSPLLRHLHDPSLMPDLDRAAERILAAAKRGETIAIYGDYDVDGVTATAILYHTLRHICPAASIVTYVPHRLEEGYGLNAEAIAELADAGAKVIVSVDCGITAVEPARVASERGVDLIITDHHNPPADDSLLPPAFAVVHPRRPGSQYPYGELCGAGVAFKLAWRLATMECGGVRVSDSTRDLLLELLGLCSLGVIADVVPLNGENRVIASFGLKRIKHSRLEGLRALVEASGLAGENVEAEDVGFKLGPRLNACGRMGHAREAVELLTTATGPRAIEIATQLSRQNDERRATEQRILEEAIELAQAAGMTGPDRRAIVLAAEGWHAGVVGIVCSRLVERFHRPAVLMVRNADHCAGSGRSIDGFNLHGALEKCAARLLTFGGHDMAAGMRVSHAEFAAFVEEFTAAANAGIAPESLVGTSSYDCDADLSELSVEVVRELGRLGPFGRENPAVRLALRGVRIAWRTEVFGRNNKHLSLKLRARATTAREIRAVGWNMHELASKVRAGETVDVLASPRISTFGGVMRVELDLIDIRRPG